MTNGPKKKEAQGCEEKKGDGGRGKAELHERRSEEQNGKKKGKKKETPLLGFSSFRLLPFWASPAQT